MWCWDLTLRPENTKKPPHFRIHLHGGRIQRDSLNADNDNLFALEQIKDRIEQAAPFAALLDYMQDLVQNLQVRQLHVASLHRQPPLIRSKSASASYITTLMEQKIMDCVNTP